MHDVSIYTYMENRFSKLFECGNLLIIPMKHEIASGMLPCRLGRKLQSDHSRVKYVWHMAIKHM